MKKYILPATTGVVLGLICLQVEAASIDSVSGLLTANAGGANDTVISGLGDFSVSNVRTVSVYDDLSGGGYYDVSISSAASTTITTSRIDISATAGGFYDIWSNSSALTSASGTLDFSLSSASNIFYNYDGSIGLYGSNSAASLYGADGALILECQNEYDCFSSSAGGNLPLIGSLLLNPGSYHLTFSTYATVEMDYVTGGYLNMSLELEPVPVPAAFWLFGSGLVCLFGAAKRKAG